MWKEKVASRGCCSISYVSHYLKDLFRRLGAVGGRGLWGLKLVVGENRAPTLSDDVSESIVSASLSLVYDGI